MNKNHQLEIHFKDLRDLPVNMVSLFIVQQLKNAGAPIRLKKNLGTMVGILRPITDDDIEFYGEIRRYDGYDPKYPLTILFTWGDGHLT